MVRGSSAAESNWQVYWHLVKARRSSEASLQKHDEVSDMCNSKQKCEKPENLKGEPGECSPEQVRKCHGTAKCHPCTPKADKDEA